MEQLEWYLPVSQAAEILGCHRRDIYKLANVGQLSFVQLPDSEIKISENSIHQLMGDTMRTSSLPGCHPW